MTKKEIECPRCKGTGQILDPSDKHGWKIRCPLCKRFGWMYANELKKKGKKK